MEKAIDSFADHVASRWIRKKLGKRPKAYLVWERFWTLIFILLFWFTFSDLFNLWGISLADIWVLSWPSIIASWIFLSSIFIVIIIVLLRRRRTLKIAVGFLSLTIGMFISCSIFTISLSQALIAAMRSFGIRISTYIGWLSWINYYLSLFGLTFQFEGILWTTIERLIPLPIIILILGGNGLNQTWWQRTKEGVQKLIFGTIRFPQVLIRPFITIILQVRKYDGDLHPDNLERLLEKNGFDPNSYLIIRNRSREERTGSYFYQVVFPYTTSILMLQASSGRIFVEALPFRDINWLDQISTLMEGRFELELEMTINISNIDIRRLKATCQLEYRLVFSFKVKQLLHQRLGIGFSRFHEPRNVVVRDFFHELPVRISHENDVVRFHFASRRHASEDEGHAYFLSVEVTIPVQKEKQGFRIGFVNLKIIEYYTKLLRLHVRAGPNLRLTGYSHQPRLFSSSRATFVFENLAPLERIPFWVTLEEIK